VNPSENPVFRFLQKRLLLWEILLGALTLGLFWFIANSKGSELATVTVVGLGVLIFCVIYPRGSFYVVIVLVFLESFIGGINQVSVLAKQFGVPGFNPLLESAFLYMILPWLIFTVALGYIISRWLSNPVSFGMLTTEYIMLVPPLLCITFVPLSIALEHPHLPIVADCLPGLFFVLGIIIARVFFPVRGLFFILLNTICISNHILGFGFLIFALTSGLLTKGAIFVVWSGRILMGPTDLNIFLVPMLLCVMICYKKELSPGWRQFYGFSFWAFFLRLIFAMFRGPIAATLLALVVVYYLLPAIQRIEMRRYMLRMLAIALIIIVLFVLVVPFGDLILYALFVERFTGIFQTGEEHEAAKLSLAFRAKETRVVWEEIMESPIIGHGPGAELDFRFVARLDAERRAYIHNGYLWLWHKFGILGPISIILFLLAPFIRGRQLLRKNLSRLDKTFIIGIMATTVCIFPAIVTNSIIARSQGLLMLITWFTILLTVEKRVFRDEGMDIKPYL
jgi:O-antigen ligase